MRTCCLLDFAHHTVKMKERGKIGKYLNLAKELKTWVTMIPTVVCALRMVPKGLERGLELLEIGGRIENIQTKELLRSARILRRALKT